MRRPWLSIRPSTGCPAGYDETARERADGPLTEEATGDDTDEGTCGSRGRESCRDPGSRGAPGRGRRRRLSAARPHRPDGVPSRLRRLPRQRRDPRAPERARAGAGGRREPGRYLDELHRRRQRAAGGARGRRRDPEGAHRARGDRRRLEDRLRARGEPRPRPGARDRRPPVPRDGALPAGLLALRAPGVPRGPAGAVARPPGPRDARRLPAPQPRVLPLRRGPPRRGEARRGPRRVLSPPRRGIPILRGARGGGDARVVRRVVEHRGARRGRPGGDQSHPDAGRRRGGGRLRPPLRSPPAPDEPLRGGRRPRAEQPAGRAGRGAPHRARARVGGRDRRPGQSPAQRRRGARDGAAGGLRRGAGQRRSIASWRPSGGSRPSTGRRSPRIFAWGRTATSPRTSFAGRISSPASGSASRA